MSSTDWQATASALEAAIARGDESPNGAIILDALKKWAEYTGDAAPSPDFIKTIEQAREYTSALTRLQGAVDAAREFTRHMAQRQKAGIS